MKKLVFPFLFIPLFAFPQKRRVVLDSIGNHGLLIHDSIIDFISWSDAKIYSTKMSKDGWRLPEPSEQKDIFEKTVDPFRGFGIIPGGTYFSTKEMFNAPSNDYRPLVGRMSAKYMLLMTDDINPTYQLFLVKPF